MSKYYIALIILLTILFPYVNSVSFKISRFDADVANIIYKGDAQADPENGFVEMNIVEYKSRVGHVVYADKVRIWDSKTGKLTNISTHFTFFVDTQGKSLYAAGLTFYLVPVGFQIPINSACGFLGLFNTTTIKLAQDQIVFVEFDTNNNPNWDPPDVAGHVGINNNSVSSTVYTPWNVSLHDRDNADVWINYDAATMNLSVKWSYQKTNNLAEHSSLSLKIDLRKVLPEWATVGFSAATSDLVERHVLSFWEFSSSLESEEKSPNSGRRIKVIISSVVVSAAVIFVAVSIILRRWMDRKGQVYEDTVNLTSMNFSELEKLTGPRKFSYEELVSATKNFSDDRRLGEGGFGTVYRGLLVDLNIEVAVKRISKSSKQGEKEYMTEVKIISQLRHRNLVQLLGWCHERGELLLVYDFMSNRSLDTHLFGKRTPLSWDLRYNIALGLASGLLYLHEEWEQCVVHRDIKSSNLMLDSSFVLKLGDFGLARLIDRELGPQTTKLAGTFGYLAPECLITSRTCKESDVYSFGVVMLEIATGKCATNEIEESSYYGLVGWVWDLYGREQLHSCVDEKLNGVFDKKQVECLLIVGLWCAHPDFRQRASIRQAIHVLNFEVELPDLPTAIPVPTFQMSTSSSYTCLPSNASITNSSILVGR